MCEVILGLASEHGEGDEGAEREDKRLQNIPRIKVGCCHADGVCLHQGESGKEDQVLRIGLALPVGCQQECQCTEDGKNHEPAAGLYPCPVTGIEERDGAEDGCKENLSGPTMGAFVSKTEAPYTHMLSVPCSRMRDNSQDRVHLSHELHPNLNSTFRHHATKLTRVVSVTHSTQYSLKTTCLEVIRNIVALGARLQMIRSSLVRWWRLRVVLVFK